MLKLIIKKLAAAVVTAALLLPQIPVFAESDYLVNINFDDVSTNGQTDAVVIDGSSNSRVVEDGAKNKSLMADCGNMDNLINIFLPEYEPAKQYAVQFDIRIEGDSAEGELSLSGNTGSSMDILTMDESSVLHAPDNRAIGSIKNTSMNTVTIMVDTEVNTCSIGLNGRIIYYRQPMETAISKITGIEIAAYASRGTTKLYLDNIRVYNGENYKNKKQNTIYNSDVIDFTETDESGLADRVYYKNELNSSSEMTMSKTPKTNTIEWIDDGADQFARLTKLTSDDAMIDITVGQATKKIIIEMDVKYTKSMPETLIYLRDSSTSTQVNITPVTFQGTTMMVQGTNMEMRKNTWYKISIALDITKSLYDVYVNDVLFVSGKGITSDFTTLTMWRVYIGGTELGSVDIDNLAIYGGTEPRDVGDAEVSQTSRYSDTSALNFLRGKRALQLYGNTAFLNGEKTDIGASPVRRDEMPLTDKETFEKFFDVTVREDGDAITVGSAKMTVGSDVITVSGREYRMQTAPVRENGNLYLPAAEYGEYAGVDGFYNDGHGMIVIGSNIDEEDTRIKDANLYLYFDRKPAAELKEIFLAQTDNGAEHPRLIANAEDFERLKTEVKTDPIKSEWYSSVIATADQQLEKSMPEYIINDGRLLDVSNDALSTLEYLGFAYRMTGDRKYAEKGIAYMEAICAFPDWHPDHYLDTGTMASAVAIGFDWLYDAMTEEQRENIASKAKEYALDTAKRAYYASADFNDFWAETETNWGIICNGGIANLALATAEYNTDEVMDILQNALRSIEIPWYRIAPDGAWYEGTNYWGYLLTHLTLFMSSYRSVMGEPFGEDYMGMDKYAYFQAYFQGPDGLPNNFHDADETFAENAGQFYMAKIYGDTSLMLYRINQMDEYNIKPGIFDIMWCDAGLTPGSTSIELDNSKYFGETEFVAVRENWNSDDSAWLSFHGGYSNNAHDHIDNGTFVYNIGGIRWAVDLGRDMLSYTSDAQNPSIQAGYDSRYFYRRKGEGHNIVVIDPDEGLEMDPNAFSQVSRPVDGVSGTYASIDLTSAYAEKVSSYVRGYLMTDARRTLTVRDEISLTGESVMHWFMHTRGDIRIVDNNTAVIYQDGKALKLQFITNAEGAQLKAAAAEPLPTSPQFRNTDNTGYQKIDYELNGSGDIYIAVKISLLDEIGSSTGVTEAAISEWDALINAPLASAAKNAGTARLTALRSDGQEILNFSPDGFRYTVTRDESGRAPEITVGESDNAVIETFTGYNGSEMKAISLKDADGNTTVYVVEIQEYDPTSIDAMYTRNDITAIDVSSEQIEEGINNIKEHSCDNDLDTRWSANGTDEWCIYDLGESKPIDAVAVAFWMGNQRQFSFEIEVSEDGENFTNVLIQQTDGMTESPVAYEFSERVNARYIRFIGHGSNANEWNNVIEFMALTRK